MNWLLITLAVLATAAVIAAAVALAVLELRALARASRVDDAQRFPRLLASQDAAASKNVQDAPANRAR